jgi:hypothetical protein
MNLREWVLEEGGWWLEMAQNRVETYGSVTRVISVN